MPDSWDADDLPQTYWILGTLHGYRFILDVAEGDRIAALLEAYQEGRDLLRPVFLTFADYTGATVRVQYGFIDACFLSTPSARAFDDAITTDRKKPGWGERGDDT